LNLSWKKLFEVRTEHQYSSVLPPFFHITPSSETVSLIRNYGLLFRTADNQFTLLYSTNSESDEIVNPIKNSLKLRFYISLKYSDFHSITDIPFEADKIFLFSNIQSEKDGDELPLHSESPADKFTTDADSYTVELQFLKISEESTIPVQYELVNDLGETVFQKTFTPVENIISFEYDFSHRSAGLYELRKDGIKVKSFYADNFLMRNKTFAVVEIHTGEGVPDDYKFVDSNGAVTSRSYKLKFRSRSSTWRYYIIPRSIVLDGDDTLVVEGNSEITFSTGVSKTLPNGSAAFVFESVSEFPLFKESQKNIALKKEDGASKTLINQLPSPGASNIMIEEEKVYSDIFVYI